MTLKPPLPGKRNILITSALPYVNNVPHLGNIIGSVLSGDVFNRYCRLRDYHSLHVGGTDEYGTATETKALELGKTPQEVCDEFHKIHAGIYEWFNIDFDRFGRTTTEMQTKLTQEMFLKIHQNGYLFTDIIEQLYCPNCTRFLADRFIEGTCPFCLFDDARGDQCDKCGKLINVMEMKEPKCKICKTQPTIKQSEHFFFDLPKVQDELNSWFTGICSSWTHVAKTITEGWLKEGLRPRCITRDLKWGTKVPYKGFEEKVFYVWFDAPIGYLSISAANFGEWHKWWKGDIAQENVELFQFMAKDNVPFHSIMFKAALIASGEPWVKQHNIIAVDYLNYENTKFSKSRGTGVFGNDAQSTGIPADLWRFYLLYIRPEGMDSSFSWDDFKEKVNSELLNNLGNFINRALSFIGKNFDFTLNHYKSTEEDESYVNEVGQNLKAYFGHMEKVHLRDGLKTILSISKAGNQLIQANKPWVLVKGDEDESRRAESVMYLAVNTVALIAMILSPFMPCISQTIKKQLALECSHLPDVDFDNKPDAKECFPFLIPLGHKIGDASPLFQRIEADKIKELKTKFGPQVEEKNDKKSKPKKQTKQSKQPKQLKEQPKQLEQSEQSEQQENPDAHK